LTARRFPVKPIVDIFFEVTSSDETRHRIVPILEALGITISGDHHGARTHHHILPGSSNETRQGTERITSTLLNQISRTGSDSCFVTTPLSIQTLQGNTENSKVSSRRLSIVTERPMKRRRRVLSGPLQKELSNTSIWSNKGFERDALLTFHSRPSYRASSLSYNISN